VIASVRSERDVATSQRAGAHHVVVTGGLSADEIVERILTHAPHGIDHIVEVAFHPNISVDERLLRLGGSIATYATGDPTPAIPFWPLVFKNVRLFFLGSDDFPAAAKIAATRALNETLEGGWPGFEVEATFPLASIAKAHEVVEEGRMSGRVVVKPREQEGAA
jgi:NADPH2:quinone reductase